MFTILIYLYVWTRTVHIINYMLVCAVSIRKLYPFLGPYLASSHWCNCLPQIFRNYFVENAKNINDCIDMIVIFKFCPQAPPNQY